MYISDIKKTAKATAFIYSFATLFVFVFALIYEKFSHGVVSYFMVFAFAVPLILGVLPYAVIYFKPPELLSAVSYRAYNAAVALITVGMVFKGVIEIYGTESRFVPVYFIAAAALIIVSAIVQTAIFIKKGCK